MSHIVTINTEVRDASAIAAACKRLNIEAPMYGTAKLFNSEQTGMVVKLTGWTYPAVCDVATGELHYDNFEGRWGDPAHLSKFLQFYAVEKARLEAQKRGHVVREQACRDGSVRLSIYVGG